MGKWGLPVAGILFALLDPGSFKETLDNNAMDVFGLAMAYWGGRKAVKIDERRRR